MSDRPDPVHNAENRADRVSLPGYGGLGAVARTAALSMFNPRG
jgi:hypothetical protein